MKATGIVRRIDDLGRVVIPKEIRRTMRIREGDPLEIYTEKDGEVIFKKYSLIGGLEEFAAQFCDTLSRSTDFSAAGRCELALLRSACRGKAPFADIRGVSEGLEHRLEAAVRTSTTYDELLDALTTVRYPRARMRRLAMDASLARLRGSGGACTQMAEAQLAAADFGTLCHVSPEAMGGLLRQKNIFLT